MSAVETGEMSSVETGQMSAVGTGQMSAAETVQMSSAETRQMATGQTVSPIYVWHVSRPMEGHVYFYDTNFPQRSHPELLPLSRMSKS